MVHFVITRDPRKVEPLRVEEFTEEAPALARFEALEDEHRGRADREVYYVASDSWATARATHANLFGGATGPHAAP
jgi:hypothetical protein